MADDPGPGWSPTSSSPMSEVIPWIWKPLDPPHYVKNKIRPKLIHSSAICYSESESLIANDNISLSAHELFDVESMSRVRGGEN